VAFGGAAVVAGPAAPVDVRTPGGAARHRAGALHRAEARERHPQRPMVQQGHGVPLDGARPPRPPRPAPAAGHVLRAAVRAVHKLVPVAGEEHPGRAGLHRRAGQVEDPQQAARPERDTVLQGADRQHQGFCAGNIHSHCRLGL